MPDGSISTEYPKTCYLKDRFKIFKYPFFRGIASFVDSIVAGYGALNISAEKAFLDEDDKSHDLRKKENKFVTVIMTLASVLGIVLAMALFMAFPAYVYNLTGGIFGKSMLVRSLFEGVFRMVIFILYLLLCSSQKDIKRLFMYHGAEHKTIFCYESGKELNVENVKKQKRFHPRCGTSFILILLIVGIVVGFFIPFTSTILRAITKIICIPIVIALGYELIRICGKHQNFITKIICAPGMWIQHITTKEPTDDMIEVAIEALKAVVPEYEEKTIEIVNSEIRPVPVEVKK
jgi:uncharacterized protein YqhQ